MEGLDIKIIERKEDLGVILDNPGYLTNSEKWDERGSYHAVAVIDRKLAGFWDGGICAEKLYWDIKKDLCFYSLLFLSWGRGDFGVKGVGTEIKKHQLKFAQSLGYLSSYCEVRKDNTASLKIQKRLGADIVETDDVYQCSFDFGKLNF